MALADINTVVVEIARLRDSLTPILAVRPEEDPGARKTRLDKDAKPILDNIFEQIRLLKQEGHRFSLKFSAGAAGGHALYGDFFKVVNSVYDLLTVTPTSQRTLRQVLCQSVLGCVDSNAQAGFETNRDIVEYYYRFLRDLIACPVFSGGDLGVRLHQIVLAFPEVGTHDARMAFMLNIRGLLRDVVVQDQEEQLHKAQEELAATRAELAAVRDKPAPVAPAPLELGPLDRAVGVLQRQASDLVVLPLPPERPAAVVPPVIAVAPPAPNPLQAQVDEDLRNVQDIGRRLELLGSLVKRLKEIKGAPNQSRRFIIGPDGHQLLTSGDHPESMTGATAPLSIWIDFIIRRGDEEIIAALDGYRDLLSRAQGYPASESQKTLKVWLLGEGGHASQSGVLYEYYNLMENIKAKKVAYIASLPEDSPERSQVQPMTPSQFIDYLIAAKLREKDNELRGQYSALTKFFTTEKDHLDHPEAPYVSTDNRLALDALNEPALKRLIIECMDGFAAHMQRHPEELDSWKKIGKNLLFSDGTTVFAGVGLLANLGLRFLCAVAGALSEFSYLDPDDIVSLLTYPLAPGETPPSWNKSAKTAEKFITISKKLAGDARIAQLLNAGRNAVKLDKPLNLTVGGLLVLLGLSQIIAKGMVNVRDAHTKYANGEGWLQDCCSCLGAGQGKEALKWILAIVKGGIWDSVLTKGNAVFLGGVLLTGFAGFAETATGDSFTSTIGWLLDKVCSDTCYCPSSRAGIDTNGCAYTTLNEIADSLPNFMKILLDNPNAGVYIVSTLTTLLAAYGVYKSHIPQQLYKNAADGVRYLIRSYQARHSAVVAPPPVAISGPSPLFSGTEHRPLLSEQRGERQGCCPGLFGGLFGGSRGGSAGSQGGSRSGGPAVVATASVV